jgi:cytochrome c biogenesis protein
MASPPRRLDLRRSAALTWRTLRSMRTALILLLLLAAAAVAGSLIPQIPNSPERVVEFLADHRVLGEIYLRAGLFDVFGTWWFVLIVALLFTSLVACLLPRSRAHLRALTQRPVQARELETMPCYREVAVLAAPEETARVAAETLRRRRFRITVDGHAVAADKGALREAGSLVFHWAFVLLLIGAIVGKGTGYSGRAAIVEGETWTDAALNYDATHLRTGRYFDGAFTGLGLRLVDYRDAFDPETGLPLTFESEVDLLDATGAVVGTEVVAVNAPVRHGPLRIHQFGFGWAPVLMVTQDGRTISDGPVLMSQVTAPEGRSQLAQTWHGFVKVPQVREGVDMAVELELWPDGRGFLADGMPMFDANAPLIRYRVWEGRLVDPSKASLDTRFMRVVRSGFVWAGATVDLERGCIAGGPVAPVGTDATCGPEVEPSLTMAFTDLPHYSVLQVSKDVGVPVVLGAAILIVLGLLASLYVSRRKVWVRVTPEGEGSRLVVGGFALQRREQFADEFDRLVQAMATAAGTPVASPEGVGAGGR